MKNSEKKKIPASGEQAIDISAKRRFKKKYDPVKIDNRSFLALLIRSFVSFTGIIVVSMVLIILFAYVATYDSSFSIKPKSIDGYDDELSQGRFSSVPVKRIFGKNGWLEIVDMKGEVVFSTHGGEGTSYTLSELDCISRYGSGETLAVLRFEEADFTYSYLITKSFANGAPDQYQLVDDELNITSGTIATTKLSYTAREFELLLYNSSGEHGKMERYSFEYGGEKYYAVYLDANEGVPSYVFIIIFAIGVLGLIAVTIFLYIRYLNRHVQKPLKALGAAMTEFARGGYRSKLIYHGSREFEQLVVSFNDMVTLLNASEEQREALEKDKQRMLAGLSHDLKTPMTVIQGFTKALRDGLISEEDKPKYLALILSKSEHMSELINEFYEYSKLEHPDFMLSMETVDAAELVRSYFAGRYSEFELTGYELEPDIVESVLDIRADKKQFVRVLDNLVNNFFKYTPEHSTLFVSVKREDGEAVIALSDNGNGIAEESREDIFAPFVVGEQSRNKQGSGLGLAVCKRIVEMHGGTIELLEPSDDEKKRGITTKFVIRLALYSE